MLDDDTLLNKTKLTNPDNDTQDELTPLHLLYSNCHLSHRVSPTKHEIMEFYLSQNVHDCTVVQSCVENIEKFVLILGCIFCNSFRKQKTQAHQELLAEELLANVTVCGVPFLKCSCDNE